MPPRSWDVVRRLTSICALLTMVTACGQARTAAPPTPEFVGAQFAAPRSVTPAVTKEQYEPDLEAIEPSADGYDVTQLTTPTGAAGANQSGWDAFDASIQSQLGSSNFAVSAAVMVGGEVVHTTAVGERVPGDPVAATDRFRIASESKVITTIVALRMVEAGWLTLDEPIGQKVVDHLGLTSYDPAVRNITLRQLLSHRSGLGDPYSLMFGGAVQSCYDAAAQGLQNVGSPGGYKYSNFGFCVTTVLLEAVSGIPYEELVYQQLLTPLGISGMRITGTQDLGPDEVQHYPTPGRNYMETLAGAGAWNATPSDMVRIINSVTPDTPGWKAVSPEMMAQMRASSPSGRSSHGYGLGLIDYGPDGFGHTGTLERTHSMVMAQSNGVTWAITVSGEGISSSSALQGVMDRALAAGFGN